MDQVSGSAGCNNYNAAVSSDGGQALTVGPAASTMMACADPIQAQETAYLTALQTAVQWSYVAGQLVISYVSEDGVYGALYYDPASSEETAETAVTETDAAPAEETTNVINVTYACANDVSIEAVFDNDAQHCDGDIAGRGLGTAPGRLGFGRQIQRRHDHLLDPG